MCKFWVYSSRRSKRSTARILHYKDTDVEMQYNRGYDVRKCVFFCQCQGWKQMTESFAREHFAPRIKIGWLGLNLSKEQTQIPHSQTLYGSHLRCWGEVVEGDISLSCHLLQKPFSTSTGLPGICGALSTEAKFMEISYHVFLSLWWQLCDNELLTISPSVCGTHLNKCGISRSQPMHNYILYFPPRLSNLIVLWVPDLLTLLSVFGQLGSKVLETTACSYFSSNIASVCHIPVLFFVEFRKVELWVLQSLSALCALWFSESSTNPHRLFFVKCRQ